MAEGKRAELHPVAAEAQAGDQPVAVTLTTEDGEADLHVLPAGKWKGSAIRAMRDGDLDTWAEKCLVGGDYARWSALDPTIDEISAFFDAWADSSGQSSGKSSASTRSSKSTARR